MTFRKHNQDGGQKKWKEPMKHYAQIGSNLEQYKTVSQKIVALAKRHRFDGHELFAIAVAVEEALINAIKHGNRFEPAKKINIEYAADFSEVYVKIVDEGQGFKVEAVQDPVLPENITRDSGRGLFFMRSLMSEIRYNAAGNQVEMWKYRTIAPSLRLEDQMQNHSNKKRQKGKPFAAIVPHILLAEDDQEMRALLARVLRKAGYGVTECSNGVELLEHLGSYFLPDEEHETIDLVISDIRMPGVTGLEILEGLCKHDDFPPFILITAFGDTETHAEAERFGALAMFDKPFDIDDLLAKVQKIVPPSE
jgi:CheY-like chemotaxis protein/anti-sigma regulatory factor (Ser/Thr protein kinase)